MSVKVTFDLNAAATRVRAASEVALKTARSEILDKCNKFCPEDQGELIKSSSSHSYYAEEEGSPALHLLWVSPYARYLYYGLLMVDPITMSPWAEEGVRKILTEVPLNYSKGEACKLWCEKAFSEYGEEWRKMIEDKIRENI